MLCATHKLDLCQDNKTVALRVTNYYRDHADNEYKYNYKYRLNTSSWSTITTPVFQTADEPAYVLCEKSAISIKILTNYSELYMTCSSEHRRPSWTNSEVSEDIYVDHPQHSVELENTEILTTEPRWFERGVKEDTVKEPWTLAWTKMGWGAICTLVWDNYTPLQRGNYHLSMFHNPTAAVNLFHVGKQYLTFCKAEAAVTLILIGRKIIYSVKRTDTRNSLPMLDVVPSSHKRHAPQCVRVGY